MSEMMTESELSDDQITAYIADPTTITEHDIARQVIDCLDAEIANIQAQVDAVMVEANVRPLSEERQNWVKRASYAAAMRKNSRHRVYQRDKELRGLKGSANMEPKRSKEEKALKQQRLLADAERLRDAKKLELANARVKELELAKRLRQDAKERNDEWNSALECCAKIAESLNGEDIAKAIRERWRKYSSAPPSPIEIAGSEKP